MEINIELLKIQNHWWKTGHLKYDPVIEALQAQPLLYKPDFVKGIEFDKEKISFIQGSRGVGKTSAIKQMIVDLIESEVEPKNIFYYSCHNLNTKEQLNEIIKTFVNWRRKRNKENRLYVFIDEITLLSRWENGIKYLENAGIFRNVRVVLAGSFFSPLSLKKPDFKKHEWESIKAHTLTFRESLALFDELMYKELEKDDSKYIQSSNRLEYYLNIFFLTGGYISAINSFLKYGKVKQEIYSSYIYWLIADIARMDRDLILFRQIMDQLLFLQTKSFGYQTIAKKTKAKTHNTVSDYLKIIQSMFVAQMSYQLLGGTLNKSAAKKMYFRDLFNYWVFQAYMHGSLNYWEFARDFIQKKDYFEIVIENTVFSQLLKAENFENWENSQAFTREGNLLVKIENNKFIPILLKYNKEIKEADLSVFDKFASDEAIVITRDLKEERGKIKFLPLTYFLLYY